MKRLKITLFKEGGGKLSFGHTPTKRDNITTLYQLAERKLEDFFRQRSETKTGVIVIYGHRDHKNESYDSTNLNYLLFCLVCFLEDYLSDSLIAKRKKKFLKGMIQP